MLTAPSVLRVEDGGGLLGFLAVDSLVAGRCCGGLRMCPDVGEEELRLLARCMTLKYGLLGLPQGGAKAGVMADPDAGIEVRRQALGRFGSALGEILRSGWYKPGADMGTTNADIVWMMLECGMVVSSRDSQERDSGFWTALGVIAAAREASARLGVRLRGSRAVIHGFGSVGTELARLLDEAGVKIVAVATSRGGLVSGDGLEVSALLDAAAASGSRLPEAFPARRVPAGEVLEAEAEFLFPCARHWAIHEENAGAIRAAVMVPAANVPCTPGGEAELLRRGIACVPDFVANCGGVLGGTMEFAGIQKSRIMELLPEWIGCLVARLIEASAREGRTWRELAEEFALRRHAEIRRAAENPTLARRLLNLGVRLHRAAAAPEPLVRRLAERYFERLIADARF